MGKVVSISKDKLTTFFNILVIFITENTVFLLEIILEVLIICI